MVLFTLEAHRQHNYLRRTDDLVQGDIACAGERDDQFALCRVLRSLAEAEGRDGQAVLHAGPYGVDCRLGTIEVFGCVGLVEQKIKEALQILIGRASCAWR